MHINSWFIIFYNLQEMLDFLLCNKILFNLNMTKKKLNYFLIFFITFLAELIFNIIYPNTDTGTRSLFYGMLIPLFILKENKLKGFIIQINVYAITSLLDVLLCYIYFLYNKLPFSSGIPIHIQFLINFNFMIIAAVITTYNHIFRKRNYRLELRTFHWLLLTAFLTSIILSISFLQYASNVDKLITPKMLNIYGLLLSIIGIIFVLIIIMLAKFIQKNLGLQYEKNIIDIHVQTQAQYVDTIITKDNDMRRFRHDIKEQLLALQGYMQHGDYEAAYKYLENMTKTSLDCNIVPYTGLIPVDAIINDIHNQMKEKNITLNWNGSLKSASSRTDISIYDICTLFVNILKNAMEACEKLDENRVINVTAMIYKNKISIIADNPYLGQISYDNNGRLITTKNDTQNHGFGSLNIKKVVDKYSGILNYTTNNNLLTVEILI